ncbi:MAG: ABC transporter permease [bacterium]|nr:MAG: ABC transporter permease [bacterium]
MISNYLKVAIRNISRNRIYSFLNIIGLAIGVACFLFIYMFVRFELSYDQFHEKSDRIYRIAVRALIGDTRINQTHSSAIVFTRMREEFPEIENGVKFLNFGRTPVILGNRTFYESRIFAVDSTFFEVFTNPLLHGDPEQVLNKPNSMVISRSLADKYFGHTEVLGEIIQVEVSPSRGIMDFAITGVAEDMPENSHFHYDILISSITFPDLLNNQGWSWNNFVSYILLKEGASAAELETKLIEFNRKYMDVDDYEAWAAKGNYYQFYLQPITKIHLTSDLNGEFEANGNETYVHIFSIVSVFVLLIASINFMNLSTAKSAVRAKEVGMRKVVGSNRTRLIGQFLTESIFLSFISLICGLLIVESILPLYQNFIGRSLQVNYLGDAKVIPALIFLGLLIGAVSGSYPAFALSSFKPIQVIGGNLNRGKKGVWFRNILVLVQFTISIFLIIGTIVVFQQLKHFQSKNLGFDKDQVLVIKNPSSLGHMINPLKESIAQHPQVEDISGSNTLPGRSFSNRGFRAEGIDGGFTLNMCVCDPDFLETLKIKLRTGRFFAREFASDSTAIVLNQKAVELLGWNDPIGKRILIGGEKRIKFNVIGVIEDYHYESLHQEIRPMGLFLAGGYFRQNENFISVRLRTENVTATIEYIRSTWKKFVPQKPFEYSFLDEDYNSQYLNEEQTRKIFSVFSFLAIFIACLGLFGLASFSAQRRTREVGIRKALGASFTHIILILNQEFLKWVLIANVIAWPLAYYFMNSWLQNFAYRINIEWWIFLLAAVVALIIAVMTVSFQSIKAAFINPSDALRYE